MLKNNNRHPTIAVFAFILGLMYATLCRAACIPQDLGTPAPQDPVARILAAQSACPKDAVTFVGILRQLGARLEPTVVDFVGFHNPEPVLFFFEIVSSDGNLPSPSDLSIQRGDLLFGHFTNTTNDRRLVSEKSGLTVELIGWDPNKQFYNFYDVVNGTWIYRGDSKDILDDVQLLHRQRNASESAFGRRLRCSGCHINGGLLQKELAPPHNDWSLPSRQLPLGTLTPDPFVREELANVVDAGELSKLVSIRQIV